MGLRYVTIAAVSSKASVESAAAGDGARKITSPIICRGFNVCAMQGRARLLSSQKRILNHSHPDKLCTVLGAFILEPIIARSD